jgi:hypothetical protein
MIGLILLILIFLNTMARWSLLKRMLMIILLISKKASSIRIVSPTSPHSPSISPTSTIATSSWWSLMMTSSTTSSSLHLILVLILIILILMLKNRILIIYIPRVESKYWSLWYLLFLLSNWLFWGWFLFLSKYSLNSKLILRFLYGLRLRILFCSLC